MAGDRAGSASSNLDRWRRVELLVGSTFGTARGSPFTVDSVTETAVVVTPGSTGRSRRIPRAEIEASFEVIGSGDARPIDVRASGASEYNPAYCAAIVNAARARD
jgi:hypothetical protein